MPGGRDDLQSQLDALTAGHDVDDELARMKAQLPAGSPACASRAPRRHQPIRRHRRDGPPHRERALAARRQPCLLRRIAASEHAPQTPDKGCRSQRSPCL